MSRAFTGSPRTRRQTARPAAHRRASHAPCCRTRRCQLSRLGPRIGTGQDAIAAAGLEILPLEIRRVEDIEPAFAALNSRADAVYVCSADALINNNRDRINALALAAKLPTVYGEKPYAEAGGLIAYGPQIPVMFKRAAEIVDKILKGAKPADIPVEQPTVFELVINLKTAKALELTVPSTMLALADEVIE